MRLALVKNPYEARRLCHVARRFFLPRALHYEQRKAHRGAAQVRARSLLSQRALFIEQAFLLGQAQRGQTVSRIAFFNTNKLESESEISTKLE